jgi:hypothetical protein
VRDNAGCVISNSSAARVNNLDRATATNARK